MKEVTREQVTDKEIQMLIDSHENGTAMFLRVDAYYLMAKELQERRNADSEPVAWLAIYHGEVYDDAIGITRSVVEAQADRFGWESALTEIIPLYRHAQQPVVPDVMEPTIEAIKRILPTSNPDEYAACIGADIWNACRDTMLDRK